MFNQDNLFELTAQIVNGYGNGNPDQKMYDNYDKVLMAKVKIYRPKKFKFNS